MADDEAPPEPKFLQFADGEKVHVLRRLSPLGQMRSDPPDTEYGDGQWIMAAQVAWCGRRGTPGPMFGISTFADDELCQRCVSAWPHDTVLLFEHDVPE